VIAGTFLNWRGQERFGEIALAFASIDLDGGYSATSRSLLISLLEAVAYGFGAERDEVREMTSYRLLMKYDGTSDQYRSRYIGLLIKCKEFLERELRVLRLGRIDWLNTAERIKHYFSVLVDDDLQAAKIGEYLHQSGETIEEFEAARDKTRDNVEKARELLSHHRYAECLGQLDSSANLRHGQWLFLAQLESLDMWLECAQFVPELLPTVVSEKANLLQTLSMRYIAQLGNIIKDSQAQRLAMELLDTLRTGTDLQKGGPERRFFELA
jgi:hypothetical protein